MVNGRGESPEIDCCATVDQAVHVTQSKQDFQTLVVGEASYGKEEENEGKVLKGR